MAAFDFPSSPNVNDIYTLNGVAFMWNGSVWKRYSTSTGAQGFQGAAGAVGAQGAQGTNGTIGSDGAQGAQGHQGATGTGATGAQGAAGATGAQGAAGATGAQGTPFDRSEYNYTASGGQTAFAAAYANASDVDVFMNGVRLTPAEFTPSGGTTITLASGATAGDIIDILTFASAGPTGAQGAQGHQGDAFNRSESNFTATSGQTSFAPAGGYTNGDDLDVFVNGVRLTPADYTATNGTNVVLDVGANTGDIVDIIYYEAAGPAGAQGSAGIAGTVTFSTGAPSNPINGDLWYDTDDGAFAGYYDDGSTSQWIDLSGGPRGAQGADGAQGAAGSIPSNINAVNGTFSGNVSIGGTLTYEDVTNIDSVGIITAHNGVDTDTVRGKTNNSNLAIGARASNGAFVQTITIKPDRSVGLGNITNPTSILDVRQTNTGAATEIKLFNLDQSNATTQTAALVMTPDVRANGVKIVAVKEVADMSSSANKDLALTFQSVANNTAVERLRIRSDGKISAGTLLDTSNSYEFSIRGADGTGCLYAHGRNHYLSTRSTSHASLTLKKSNSDSDGIDYLQMRDSSNAAKFVLQGDGTLQVLDSIKHMGDTNTAIRFPANDTVTVETGGSERLRIASDGTVHVNSPDTASGGRIYAAGSKLYLSSGNGRQSFNIADMAAGQSATHEFNSSGNLVLASGSGIDFSANSNAAGMTSEVLDDYEEGTFTPSWGDGSSSYSSPSPTYSIQSGHYTKVGNTVYFDLYIATTAWNNAGTVMWIYGMPYAARNSGQYQQAISGNFCIQGVDGTGAINTLTGQIQPGVSLIQLYYQTASSGNNYNTFGTGSVAETNNVAIRFNGFYFIS